MSQRLSLDRGSFKRWLSALFQQIRSSADIRIDPPLLTDLIPIRQEVKSGKVDLNVVMNRLAKLTQRALGAGGAGVWLFADNEIFYCAGAGNASNDERLRLQVISKLASSCQLGKDTPPRLGKPIPKTTVHDTSYDLGSAKSLLVEPIYQGTDIAGALAAFSDEFQVFTERDAANIHSLADVLAQALSKAEQAGLKESVALEPAAMLQLIERIIPGLERLLESDESARHSMPGFQQSDPEPEPPAASMDTIPLQESHESDEKPRATEAIGGTWAEHRQVPPGHQDSANSRALEDTNVPRIGVWAALQSMHVEPSTSWPVVRQKWEHTVAFVRNHAARGLKFLRLAGSRLLQRVKKTGQQVWRTARHSPDSPPLPMKAAHRSLQWMKAAITSAGRSANARLHMQLHSWRRVRAFRRAGPLLAILVIAITFLILKTGLHNPLQTTASHSRTAAQGNTAPLSADSPGSREPARSDGVAAAGAPRHGAEPFRTDAPLQVSHLRVTDRTTEDAIRTLSRYELAALRRRGLYGDDFAAFQMGMAYETGRQVPQSCTTAAQWVARAASEGNAAAQYNLGLRYRDGDGVPVNGEEAVKWLQKAVAQRSSDAKLALAVLTTHEGRFVASRP